MLKKILKRKDESPTSSSSPLASSSSGRQKSALSMRSSSRDAIVDLNIAKLLESNVEKESDVDNLREHAKKLTKALRDEREYTQSLKNQVDRLHLVQMQPSNQVQEELMVVKKMFEETDQARFEATSELEQVKQKLTNLETEYEKTKAVGQRAAQTAAEMASLKSECDEFRSKTAAMDAQVGVLSDELIRRNQELIELKQELESRPTTDDVSLLKKEMHGLQENFLKAALDKENEVKEIQKKKNELSEEWARSQARIKALEAELGAKSMTSSEHVQRLEFQVQDLKDQLALAPKQTDFDRQSETIRELEKKLAEREKPEEVARLQERVKSLDHQLTLAPKQKDLDEKLTLIAQLEAEKNAKVEMINSLKTKIKEVDQELRDAPKHDYVSGLEQRLQETENALKTSKADTVEKDRQYHECQKEVKQTLGIVAEKDASLARLARDLEKANALAREEATLKGACQEEAKQKQALLEEEGRKVAARKRQIGELENDLRQVRESVTRLESERADLIEKIEAGEGVATAIDQLSREKEVLQQRLSQLEETSRAELKKIETTAEERDRQLRNLSNEVESWKEKFREQSVNLGRLEQERERLSEDYQGKVSVLADVKRESQERESDFEAKLAAEKEALRIAQDRIKERESECGQVKADLTQKLDLALRERDDVVASLKETLQSKEDKIESLESSLSRSLMEQRSVQDRLTETDASLTTLKADYDALNAEHFKTKDELAEKVEIFDRRHDEICQKADELKQKSSVLEDSLTCSSKELDLLKSQLSESEVKASKLSIRIEELENELEKARASALEEKDVYESKLGKMEMKVSEANSKIESLEASVKAEKGSSAELKTSLDERLRRIQETNDELAAVNVRNDELNQQLKTESERAAALQGHLTELDSQLLQQIDQRDSREQQLFGQLSKKDEQIKAMQSDLHMLHQEMEGKGSVCNNYEMQLVRIQAELKEEKSRVVSLERELDGTKKELTQMNEQSNIRDTELATLRKSADETERLMNSTVEQLTEVKSALSDRLVEQDNQLKNLKAKIEKLNEEKNDLSALLKAKENAIMTTTQKRSEVERDKEDLMSDLATEREERSKEQRLFEESSASAKTQIQNLERELESINKEKKRMEDESESREAKLRVQLTSVTSELEQIRQERANLKDAHDDMKVQHEVEMSALSGNLATLRTEVEARKRKVAAEERVSNKLRGDIAVLQASMQNFQDERRKLLERCVGSDEEIQKLRGHAANLKQRLDETHAALQDLGRENAALQVNRSRKLERRWIDDNEIKECSDCKKKFSLTMRKHHCRNCGLIFCYECSSKTVKLPAYKDPVRVCIECYKEKTA